MNRHETFYKKALIESGILTTKQRKDLNKLKFTELELEKMVMDVMKDMADRLTRARREYRAHVQEIEKLKSPALWKLERSHTAPPDFKEEYTEKLRESRREMLRAINGDSGS